MANEKRMICLDEAIQATHKEIWWTESQQAAVRSLPVKLSRVDAVEVVHGRWVWKPIQNKHWTLTCSVCSGTKNASEDCNYCPNCGADMRERETNDN